MGEQRKEHDGSVLRLVRIGVLTVVAVAALSSIHMRSASATGTTAAILDSESGDYIGAGQTLTFTSVTASGSTTAVHVSVASSGHSYNLEFAPIAGQTLVPGVYEDAERYPFRRAGHPGFSVGGDGRGCNTMTGRFIVDEITTTVGGGIATFAARFEQHCEGYVPALLGAVSFNASTPYRARTVAPGTLAFGSVNVGATGAAQDLTVTNTGPSTLTLSNAGFEGVD